jgi:hypothetical protein
MHSLEDLARVFPPFGETLQAVLHVAQGKQCLGLHRITPTLIHHYTGFAPVVKSISVRGFGAIQKIKTNPNRKG